MKQGRSKSREATLFALRACALLYLLIHLYLYLNDILSLGFVLSGFVLSLLCGALLARTRFRAVVAGLITLTAPFVLRFILFRIFSLQQAVVSSPEIDAQFFRFDSNFYPLYLPLLYVSVVTYWGIRTKKFVAWETVLNLVFLALLFWSQGRYQLSLYPHPGYAALSLFGFLAIEFSVLYLAEAIRHPADRASGRLVRMGLGVLALIVLALLSLFLLGRYTEGAVSRGGGLMKPTLFRFDFSKFLKLESEISMQDDLVLLLRRQVPQNDAFSDRILLRRFVLSGYRPGSGFFLDTERGTEVEDSPQATTVPDHPVTFPDPGNRERAEVVQDYFLVNLDPESLIAMNYPVSVTPFKNWDASSFVRIYRVVSKVGTLFPWDMADITDVKMDSTLKDYYTRYGDDSRIQDLALSITEGIDNYYDRVMAIVFYLMDNYQYSLKPGVAADGNQLYHFLFESRKGYCTYFAFSAALMLRSIGIPARVAVGFAVDKSFGLLDFLPVRADMAHAWIEVYFGEYGWIEFDPTSTTIAPGEEFRFPELDMKEFTRLIEEVMKNEDLMVPESETQTPERKALRQIGQSVSETLLFVVTYWYLFLPAFYLIVILSMKLFPYLVAASSGDYRKKVKILFCMDMRRLSSSGFLLPVGETSGRTYPRGYRRGRDESLLEWAERLETVLGRGIVPWTEAYLAAVFSDSFGEDAYSSALSARSDFLSVYSSIPLWRRILGFFIPTRMRGRL